MNVLNKLSFAAALAVVVLPSCSTRVLELAACSSSEPDWSAQVAYAPATGERVAGTSSAPFLLFFPLGRPSLEEALAKAEAQGGPGTAALSDVVVEASTWWLFLFGQTTYRLEGTPLRAPLPH